MGRVIAFIAVALLIYPSTVSRILGISLAAGLLLVNRLGRI